MSDEVDRTEAPEAPRGKLTARVDDKGRLKTPSDLKTYFEGLAEKRLFVTSLDLASIQIYPISVWRENEKLFRSLTGEARTNAKKLLALAQDVGHEVLPDGQGRVLLPAEIRRELGLENQPVVLTSDQGKINVFSQAAYAKAQAEFRAGAAARAEALEQAGMV